MPIQTQLYCWKCTTTTTALKKTTALQHRPLSSLLLHALLCFIGKFLRCSLLHRANSRAASFLPFFGFSHFCFFPFFRFHFGQFQTNPEVINRTLGFMESNPAFKLMDCKPALRFAFDHPALKLNGPIAGLIRWVLVASIAMLSCFVVMFIVGSISVLGIKFDSGKSSARNTSKVSHDASRGSNLHSRSTVGHGNYTDQHTNDTFIARYLHDASTIAATKW